MSSEYLNNHKFESVIFEFLRFKRLKIRCELILGDLRATHERNVRKNQNAELPAALVAAEAQYRQVCEDFQFFQGQLTQAFLLLSENLANYYINRYSGVGVDDATQEGVMICFEKIDRFDPDKGKAFSYMTTCIVNHFRQIYRSNKNYTELKKKYFHYLQDKFESIFYRNGKERSASDYSLMHG